MTYEDAVSG